MRIISPFKDYYDGVQSWGLDKTLVYVRKASEESEVFTPQDLTLPTGLQGYHRFFVRIGTNVRVPLLYCERSHFDKDRKGYEPEVCAGYIVGRSERDKNRRPLPRTLSTGVNGFQYGYVWSSMPEEQLFKQPVWLARHFWQDNLDRKMKNLQDFFKMEDLPIPQTCPVELFLLEAWGYAPTTNAILHKYTNIDLSRLNLAKVIDPYTCHQEIAMFVANQVNPDVVPVSVENDVRIQQHGFDLKQSFRTRK